MLKRLGLHGKGSLGMSATVGAGFVALLAGITVGVDINACGGDANWAKSTRDSKIRTQRDKRTKFI